MEPETIGDSDEGSGVVGGSGSGVGIGFGGIDALGGGVLGEGVGLGAGRSG